MQQTDRRLVLKDSGSGALIREAATDVFDGFGCEILAACGKRDIIVMDELGFLESKAAAFRRGVMKFICGDVPILGVIKPAQIDFLDEVRSHPKVEVHEVTLENRESVYEFLLERLLRKL
jgi:nucleoside-triphosphatase